MNVQCESRDFYTVPQHLCVTEEEAGLTGVLQRCDPQMVAIPI